MNTLLADEVGAKNLREREVPALDGIVITELGYTLVITFYLLRFKVLYKQGFLLL